MNPSTDRPSVTPALGTLLATLARQPLAGRQYKVLLAVFALTVGGTLPEPTLAAVEVSSSELARLTSIAPAHCREAVLELERLGVLRSRPGRRGKVIAVDLQPRGEPRASDARPEAEPPGALQRDARPEAARTPSRTRDTRPETVRTLSPERDTRPGFGTALDARGEVFPRSQELVPGSGERLQIPPPQGAGASARQPLPLRGGGGGGGGGGGAGGGGGPSLAFHRSLRDDERREATVLVDPVGADAQALLDVLAAAIQAGQVRKSPLAMLAALVRRWRAGTFDPTPGLRVTEARRRARALEAMERLPTPRAGQALGAVAPVRPPPEEARSWLDGLRRALRGGYSPAGGPGVAVGWACHA